MRWRGWMVAIFIVVIQSKHMNAQWKKSYGQSLEFSFPVTEQKKFHGALMRVWSNLYWATVNPQHKVLFLQSVDDFVQQVLYLNTSLDFFLMSYKKKALECEECVVQMREDMEHFSTIVQQSHACCVMLQKNENQVVLQHASYVLHFIKEKMENCIDGDSCAEFLF